MDRMLLTLKCEPVFSDVDEARKAVQNVCKAEYGHPGSEEAINELLLAVTEAMNNAVEHSGAGEIGIEVFAGQEGPIVRIITEGKRFDPTVGVSFPDLDAVDELPEGGFGKALIMEMADSVTYEYCAGKNIFSLGKKIHKKEEQINGD